MPTYGYQCTQCDNAFETVQKITDDPLTTCDVCGGPLRKKIFPVGIAFKGSGFYVNDYAKTTTKSAGAAPAENASDAAPATGGDADASAAPAADKAAASVAEPAAAPAPSSPAPGPAATPASA